MEQFSDLLIGILSFSNDIYSQNKQEIRTFEWNIQFLEAI